MSNQWETLNSVQRRIRNSLIIQHIQVQRCRDLSENVSAWFIDNEKAFKSYTTSLSRYFVYWTWTKGILEYKVILRPNGGGKDGLGTIKLDKNHERYATVVHALFIVVQSENILQEALEIKVPASAAELKCLRYADYSTAS